MTDNAKFDDIAYVNAMKFLNDIAERDMIAAVRFATKCDPVVCTKEQYVAACEFVKDQTIFPTCKFCMWPVLPEDDHNNCEEIIFGRPPVLDDDIDDDDDDFDPREEEDLCDGICGQPANCCTCIETVSWRNHDPADGYWTA